MKRRGMTDLSRADIPRVARFEVYSCGDPNCGPHIIGFDDDNEPMCELVLGRAQLPSFIEHMQMHLDGRVPHGRHGHG
jgi:hypothetical protein